MSDIDKVKIIWEHGDLTNPNYQWVNVELDGERIGKVRVQRHYSVYTINNINIFPEYERHGYGKLVVEYFKSIARVVIAHNVRGTAVGFWEKMGFVDTRDGHWKWEREKKRQATRSKKSAADASS